MHVRAAALDFTRGLCVVAHRVWTAGREPFNRPPVDGSSPPRTPGGRDGDYDHGDDDPGYAWAFRAAAPRE